MSSFHVAKSNGQFLVPILPYQAFAIVCKSQSSLMLSLLCFFWLTSYSAEILLTVAPLSDLMHLTEFIWQYSFDAFSTL
jgi:hypothetical protein